MNRFTKDDSVLVVSGHQAGQSGVIVAEYGPAAVAVDTYLVEGPEGGRFVEVADNMAIQGRPAGAVGKVWLNEQK